MLDIIHSTIKIKYFIYIKKSLNNYKIINLFTQNPFIKLNILFKQKLYVFILQILLSL
jgi:hypothetical protein